MRINHRQLEAFRQFMESGTVTAAAERLYVTQPAMSKMLAALEYDLGLTLFVREKKRLTPTDDARLLYKEVRRLLSSVTAIERFAQDLRHIRAGDLRIVTAASLGHTLVADAVEVFVRENPEVNVALEISSSVGQDLLAQNVDIGFSVTQFHHSALHSAPLFHADAICVVPKDHPFSQRERIVPEDLEGVDFISFLRESRMRHIIDAVFEQSRVSRRLRMEVFSSAEANALVSRGFGVSIVEPINVRYGYWPDLVGIPFVPSIEFTFSWMRPRERGNSRLSDRFLEILTQRVADIAEGGAPDLPRLSLRTPARPR
ncbi:MAG: LysR substrate-binding domain-containing protein [Ottowia sp.]|uniref:LysR substrate-binding domain-containing protein n=1 Tax=Ottowia sp. TaxID=1898956 RepID=UPI003C738FAB